MPRAESIAFVCPRFAEGPTVGGAETLLRNLAGHAVAAGRKVTFLTTCARNHFTWENELPPGAKTVDGMTVLFFPVDADRDVAFFLDVQERISCGGGVPEEDEMLWLRNSVNSRELCAHLRAEGGGYDRIVAGPYLFGLVYFAAQVAPSRTLLVPCLHNEPFAYLKAFRDMFRSVRGCMFNTAPERDLACRLFGLDAAASAVVGIALEPFEADPSAFAARHRLTAPYVLYSGRREPLKNTPLLLDYMAAFRGRTGRDVKLVFTGSGPYDLSAELAPHLIDAGFVSEREKHEAMAGALAFCHPSVNESLGIVLLEAWLAGTPGLVHGRSEVLRHQCRESGGGIWFCNYPEFEEGLTLLMDRPDLRAAMAKSGRRFVRREYSRDAVVKRMLDALDQ